VENCGKKERGRLKDQTGMGAGRKATVKKGGVELCRGESLILEEGLRKFVRTMGGQVRGSPVQLVGHEEVRSSVFGRDGEMGGGGGGNGTLVWREARGVVGEWEVRPLN